LKFFESQTGSIASKARLIMPFFLSHGGCTIFFFFFTDCPKEKL
jgi:hypothetical protein